MFYQNFCLSLFLQGIQFIVDDSGGFSGVSGEFLENIADDYPRVPVLLYSVRSPDLSLGPSNRKLTIARRLHDAVSFSKQSAFCKLIVPVGLPYLSTSKHDRLERLVVIVLLIVFIKLR